jgi:hypothetical protein
MLRFTLAALMTVAMLSGCSSTEVVAPTVSVSVGQQLIDLKKARDTGALSENDYQRHRKALIDNVR